MDVIGQAVKQMRKLAGIRQEDLADQLGMTRTTYASKEQKGNFTQQELDSISNIIGKPINISLQNKTTKTPDVPDVDAFVTTEIIKIEATLAVIVEILAEQEAARLNVPVTKLLNEFDKAIEDKEQLMRKQKR